MTDPTMVVLVDGWQVVEERLGTHGAVSREDHEWGGKNRFLPEILIEYDLTVPRIPKIPHSY